ncbi:MAG: YkgJ family cysteine cluster protein [Chitinophagaceae bacterium]
MNKRSFAAKVRHHQKAMKSFLTKVEKKDSPYVAVMAMEISREVWNETDCLGCANCCKVMTPTFNDDDIERISAHFELTEDVFKDRYLKYDKKDKDWQNKKQPCQWLDPGSNKCTIYEIRPADCAGFPHLTKKKWTDYVHVHKQNIQYCPATYRMVELMMERTIV